MGLERRGNGLYFYRKERRGRRVVSVYAGRGEIAGLIASLEQGDRREREHARQVNRAERDQNEKSTGEIIKIGEIVSALTRAHLITQGCHAHKGQWRNEQKTRQARRDTRKRTEG